MEITNYWEMSDSERNCVFNLIGYGQNSMM